MLTLATSAKTARLQYNVVHSSTKKPPSKSLSYPQIMVRAAPNFRNSTNRTPAHDTIHQTSLSTNLWLHREPEYPFNLHVFNSGGNKSPWRKPTQARGERANSSLKVPAQARTQTQELLWGVGEKICFAI